MLCRALRPLAGCLALLLTASTASAQITWSSAYSDGTIGVGGTGFADPTAAGSSTVGQLRRDSVNAAVGYWNTILDGRGNLPINWNTSLNIDISGGGTLGSFGAGSSSGFTSKGYFMGGPMYERARSDASFTPGAAGSGQINFHPSATWHYAVPGTNTTLNSGTFDLVTVLVHEIGHGLGFASGVTDHMTGRGGNPGAVTVGTTPDWYSTYDRWLQRGNGSFASSALMRTDVTQSTHGTFAGPASTFTGGNENSTGSNPSNNTTTGLYFGGPMAREVYGGPVPLFSPESFQGGSSISHVNASPLGVMNWAVDSNTVRRLQPYEIGMLLDMGWNVYNWDGSSANWKDGVGESTFTLGDSKWRTDKGIVLSAAGNASYNTNTAQAQAPVLPPSGQVTSNIVLNFGGSGSGSYTTTNDIGTVRVARLNLNSSSSATNTIAGGTLTFGLNLDGTASVLAPKIVQQGSGAFTISSNIVTNNVATFTTSASEGSVTFPGSPGLTIDGMGSGRVTISGVVSGGISDNGGFGESTATGSLTKGGTFTAVLTGNNTYGGGTTVTAGVLLVNGQTGSNSGTGTGAVVVNGGSLGGTGRVGGSVTVNTGGNLAPGDGGVGTLTIGDGLTFAGGSNLTLELNGNTAANYDRLRVSGGSVNLGGAALLASLGYAPQAADKLYILDNDPGVSVTGTFNNLAQGQSFQLGAATAYISYAGDAGLGSLTGGNDVVIAFSPVPVPEPAAVLGVACLALLLGRAAWRRYAAADLAA